jgi:hypothetical protein
LKQYVYAAFVGCSFTRAHGISSDAKSTKSGLQALDSLAFARLVSDIPERVTPVYIKSPVCILLPPCDVL